MPFNTCVNYNLLGIYVLLTTSCDALLLSYLLFARWDNATLETVTFIHSLRGISVDILLYVSGYLRIYVIDTL